ncbi:hypothetical protein LCGC14_1354490 [marine sediment metagenome]|uniref:Uncharacterized protein n=1 Tax=marine sediment metagenome TaxID=412755 RepID=A0A0F9NC78_9ZZZZ
MKNRKDKMMHSTDEKVEKKTKKRSFTFPRDGVVIKANSLEEAQAIYAKRLKGETE